MPDTTATNATQAPAATATTTESTTSAAVANTIQAATEKARAAAKAPVIEQAKPAAADTTATDKTKTTTIDMDAATLKQLTKLSKAKRDNEAKIAQLETTSKDAAILKEVKDLYAAGKKLDALAKLSGADPTEEMEALLSAYLQTGEEKDEAALATKVDALTKKIEADDAERLKQADEAKTAQAASEAANAHAYAVKVLQDAKEADGSLSYELCARPENRKEAADEALKAAVFLAQEEGITDVTEEIAASLLKRAYAAVEAELEDLGKQEIETATKRFTKTPKGHSPQLVGQRSDTTATGQRETPQVRQSQTIDGSFSKPGTAVTQHAKVLSHAQAKQKAIDAIRGLSS